MFKNAALLTTILGAFALGWAGDQPTLDYQAVAGNIDASVGKSVQWFGSIDQVISLPGGGMEIAATQIPQTPNGLPMNAKYSPGRFIIRIAIPLDTLSYRAASIVHVTGTVSEAETRILGNNEITWPVIAATRMCLWERKIPEGAYHCVAGGNYSGETDAVTNRDKFAVTCDQDGYYWTQSKFCDFVLVPGKSAGTAGVIPKR
ncbi:MAG: Slp family lipoprotein [Chitinivibrionales bacterium]|nr:Slp family lipoprotein [Chitinivibrionales bacterium]